MILIKWIWWELKHSHSMIVIWVSSYESHDNTSTWEIEWMWHRFHAMKMMSTLFTSLRAYGKETIGGRWKFSPPWINRENIRDVVGFMGESSMYSMSSSWMKFSNVDVHCMNLTSNIRWRKLCIKYFSCKKHHLQVCNWRNHCMIRRYIMFGHVLGPWEDRRRGSIKFFSFLF